MRFTGSHYIVSTYEPSIDGGDSEIHGRVGARGI